MDCFFLALCAVYYKVLTWNFDLKKENFLNAYNSNINKDYTIIHKKFSTLAEVMFHTVIDKPKILNLIEKAYESDEDKDISRKKIYKNLLKEYEFFKTYNLRQFHFHLNNNESFLRFHRPDKYGDSLIGVRSTVEWVNKNKDKIDGFEEGRIYNGFRYVFPLLQKKHTGESRHLGSVEVSFSANAIANEFAASHNIKAGFITKESIVKEKVFEQEKKNYMKSPFEGYMYEKSVKKQFEHAFIQTNIELLSQESIKKASKMISNGDIFSLESIDNNILFTFIPFKNPVSKEVVAAIILQKDSLELNNQGNFYFVLLLSGITAILFVMLYIYKEFSSKQKFRMLSKKTQNILDAQKEIVIISSGEKLIDTNKKFFEFFGYSSIDEFRNEHDCICDYFVEDERFFNLSKVPDGELWIDALKRLPSKEHIVSMKDKYGKQHIFFISMNDYDSNEILSFSNISDTMREHFSLMERVSRDKLTGAFNRDYFDNNKDIIIQDSSFKHLKLGIVIFDIDHFKIVNDTYGHNRGDEVLKQLVSIVQNAIRQEDVLIRWGGEEFLLLVNINSLVNLHSMIEHIREKISKEFFNKVGNVTCSFGATIYRGENIEDAIERADKALYEAKRGGRNRVVSKE